jgi:hypothetical protein
MWYSPQYISQLDQALDAQNAGYEIVFTLLHTESEWLSEAEIQTRVSRRTEKLKYADGEPASINPETLDIPTEVFRRYRDELTETKVIGAESNPSQTSFHVWLKRHSFAMSSEKAKKAAALLGEGSEEPLRLVESIPKAKTGDYAKEDKYRLWQPSPEVLCDKRPELTQADIEKAREQAEVPKAVFETNWTPTIPLALYDVIFRRGLAARNVRNDHANSRRNTKEWIGDQSLDKIYERRMGSTE